MIESVRLHEPAAPEAAPPPAIAYRDRAVHAAASDLVRPSKKGIVLTLVAALLTSIALMVAGYRKPRRRRTRRHESAQ